MVRAEFVFLMGGEVQDEVEEAAQAPDLVGGASGEPGSSRAPQRHARDVAGRSQAHRRRHRGGARGRARGAALPAAGLRPPAVPVAAHGRARADRSGTTAAGPAAADCRPPARRCRARRSGGTGGGRARRGRGGARPRRCVGRPGPGGGGADGARSRRRRDRWPRVAALVAAADPGARPTALADAQRLVHVAAARVLVARTPLRPADAVRCRAPSPMPCVVEDGDERDAAGDRLGHRPRRCRRSGGRHRRELPARHGRPSRGRPGRRPRPTHFGPPAHCRSTRTPSWCPWRRTGDRRVVRRVATCASRSPTARSRSRRRPATACTSSGCRRRQGSSSSPRAWRQCTCSSSVTCASASPAGAPARASTWSSRTAGSKWGGRRIAGRRPCDRRRGPRWRGGRGRGGPRPSSVRLEWADQRRGPGRGQVIADVAAAPAEVLVWDARPSWTGTFLRRALQEDAAAGGRALAAGSRPRSRRRPRRVGAPATTTCDERRRWSSAGPTPWTPRPWIACSIVTRGRRRRRGGARRGARGAGSALLPGPRRGAPGRRRPETIGGGFAPVNCQLPRRRRRRGAGVARRRPAGDARRRRGTADRARPGRRLGALDAWRWRDDEAASIASGATRWCAPRGGRCRRCAASWARRRTSARRRLASHRPRRGLVAGTWPPVQRAAHLRRRLGGVASDRSGGAGHWIGRADRCRGRLHRRRAPRLPSASTRRGRARRPAAGGTADDLDRIATWRRLAAGRSPRRDRRDARSTDRRAGRAADRGPAVPPRGIRCARGGGSSRSSSALGAEWWLRRRRGLPFDPLTPGRSAGTMDGRQVREKATDELSARRREADHRPRPEHVQGRRRGGALLGRRAVGDAVCQLEHHRQPGRARSGSADHGLLRPEVGHRDHPPVRRRVAEAGHRRGAGAGAPQARQPRADAAGGAAAELRRGRRRAALGGGLRPGRAGADGQGQHRHLREEGRARRRLHPEVPLDRRDRQFGRPVRLPPLRRRQLHPDLPHARPDRIGVGGDDRRQGHRQADRRRRRSPRWPPTRR